MYSEKYQGYYLNARVGYSSYGYTGELPVKEDEDLLNLSTWTFGAGVGYEFRPHFMIEGMAGYSRFTFPDSHIYDYTVGTGEGFIPHRRRCIRIHISTKSRSSFL